MNLEEMHTVLKAASGGFGAKYDIVSKWFTKCDIIDGKLVDQGFFERSYERLCPNKEPLGLVQFIQLIGILSRHTRQDIQTYIQRFETVKQTVIDEIRGSFDN